MLSGQVLLFMLGWSSLSWELMQLNKKYKRKVVIFSHTSYCDFILLLLYRITYWEIFGPTFILVKPQLFSNAVVAYVLRKFGCIPATKLEDRNGGSVRNIVSLLPDDRFIFLISPKGTILYNDEWRTGFYAVAREKGAHICVAGLDYEAKELKLLEYDEHPIGGGNSNGELASEHEKYKYIYKARRLLSKIVPLFPDREFNVKGHSIGDVTVLRWERFLLCIVMLYLFPTLLYVLFVVLCFDLYQQFSSAVRV